MSRPLEYKEIVRVEELLLKATESLQIANKIIVTAKSGRVLPTPITSNNSLQTGFQKPSRESKRKRGRK